MKMLSSHLNMHKLSLIFVTLCMCLVYSSTGANAEGWKFWWSDRPVDNKEKISVNSIWKKGYVDRKPNPPVQQTRLRG